MNNSLLSNNNNEDTKKAEKYLEKYVKELKIHFNLSNQQLFRILTVILNRVKKETKPQKFWFRN